MQQSINIVRRNLLSNSTGILLGSALTILATFLSIPVIVKRLGIEGYGAWETILAISVIANIFQSVISGTLLWLISFAYGSTDFKSVVQYIRIGICVTLLLFVIITPLAALFRSDLVLLLNIPTRYAEIALWVIPTIIGLAVIGSFSQIMGAAIGGFQRTGTTAVTLAISSCMNYSVVIICLILGAGLWSLLYGFIAQFLISNVGLYCIAKQVVGKFTIIPLFPSRQIVKKVSPYVGFMFLGVLSIALRDQTDKIVLASVASAEWAGYHGIALRLASLITVMCSFFYAPTIAAAGAIHSEGNHLGLHRLYTDVVSAISFLAGIVVIILAAFHEWIIIFWIGRPVPETSVILYWLLFGHTTAVILTGAGSSVCKGIGVIKIETLYIIFGLVLNIFLKFTLVPLMGAIGTVASSSLSWAISSILFVVLLHRMTDIPTTGTIRAIKTLLVIALNTYLAVLITRCTLNHTDQTFRTGIFILNIAFFMSTYTTMMILFRILPWQTIRNLKELIFKRYQQN